MRAAPSLEAPVTAGSHLEGQNSASFRGEEKIPGGNGHTDSADGGRIVSQSDPTDNALAAIASMLDSPDIHRETERPLVEEKPATPPPLEADGYSKMGPGPMAAIRFKWTVREDQGDYYVDETVGENSTPVATGPMTKDA